MNSRKSSQTDLRRLQQLESLLFEDAGHKDDTLIHLNTLRKEQHFCDAVLEVDGHCISVHRAVLASCSVYFFELFSNKEEILHKGHYKLDEDLDYDSIMILINYAYTSRLECSGELVRFVYMSALRLKFGRVVDECSRFLIGCLTLHNCLSTLCLASSSLDIEFQRKVGEYIQNKFGEIIEMSGEFSHLPCIIVDIIGIMSCDMYDDSKNKLCHLVVDWLADIIIDTPLDRLVENTHLLHLAGDNQLYDCSEDLIDSDLNNCNAVQDYKKMAKKRQIRLLKSRNGGGGGSGSSGKRSPPINEKNQFEQDIQQLVASKSIADKSYICLALIKSQLFSLSIKFRNEESLRQKNQQRNVMSSPVSASITDPFATSVMMSSVVSTCKMSPLSNMLVARCGLGAAVLNGKLIVLGGYDRGECMSSVECYDATINMWISLPPMLTARARFVAAVINGKLYACGGSNGSIELNSTEVYDPLSKTWTALPDMDCRRSSAGVAVCNDLLYVVGGLSGCNGLTSCEVFDPQQKLWTPIANLNIGRSQTAACSIGEKMLVAAGGCDTWNCTSTVECYNSVTDQWSFLPPMSIPRRGASAVYFNDMLYVVGGSDGQMSLTSVEIYEFSTSVWTFGPVLTSPRANMGCVAMEGKLYAIGGFGGKNFLQSFEYLDKEADEWCSFVPSNLKHNQVITETTIHSSINDSNFKHAKVNGHTIQAIKKAAIERNNDVLANGINSTNLMQNFDNSNVFVPINLTASTCGSISSLDDLRLATSDEEAEIRTGKMNVNKQNDEPLNNEIQGYGDQNINYDKKEKSTDCDSALIPLLCVHG